MYRSAEVTMFFYVIDCICRLAVTSRKMMTPSVSAYMIDVKKFFCLCAARFLRNKALILVLSQKKNM